MSRWLAMARTPEKEPIPCDRSTKPDKTQPEGENLAFVPFCHVSHKEPDKNLEGSETPADVRKTPSPNIDAFEERAAIHEHLGELSRADAEDLAAQSQGYLNVVTFRAAQANSTKGNEKD